MLRAESQEERERQCMRSLLLRNSNLQLVGERVRGGGSAGEHAAVELMDDASHVGTGFRVGRDPAVAVDSLRSSIIDSQRQGKIVRVARKHSVEICGAAADILLRLKGVANTEGGGSRGH